MAKLYEMFWQGTLGLEWIWDGGGCGGKPVTLRIVGPISNRDGFFKKTHHNSQGKTTIRQTWKMAPKDRS